MSKIIGWATTLPITDKDGNVTYPPVTYEVVRVYREGAHTFYETTACVTDYVGDTGYPLTLVDTIVTEYKPSL